MKIKVALTEDNKNLAASIIEKLSFFQDEIEYRFHGTDGQNMLDLLEKDNDVDVILMDIEMPNMNGIEATKQISKRYSHIKILMLTVFDDEDKIFQAIQSGAMGYLLKDETPDKINDAINMIMNGGAPMSPPIAAKALNLLRNPSLAAPENKENDFKLTKREVEVLEKISEGQDYKTISENLFISSSTVRKHIENIYKKLQVHNKVEAVQKAMKNKII